MRLEGRTWQQAAGNTDHDYVDLCLRWDLILNGPGERGRWPDCEAALRRDKWSERKLTDLWRFCEEMACGDTILLRLGTKDIYAVGQVVGTYEWHDAFNDVDGWSIGHARRVRWLWKYNGTDRTNSKPELDTYTLKLGDTTQALDKPHPKKLESWLDGLQIPEDRYLRELPVLPEVGNSVSPDDLYEQLFGEGMSSASISGLVSEIGELRRIANWYSSQSNHPSEAETIGYLVVPLFRALGWAPQRMAIEWNRIDVALFDGSSRDNDELSVVVEVKRMNNACISALPQAERYAQEYVNCRWVIVTDGLRYGVFRRSPDDVASTEFRPFAYLNLKDLRDAYPIYGDCRGSKDVLLVMGPDGTYRNRAAGASMLPHRSRRSRLAVK